MATVHEPALAPAGSPPPLTTAGGEPVSVVHVTAEYFPFARTGGLAEAVSGLAHFQRAAGLNVLAVLPLYFLLIACNQGYYRFRIPMIPFVAIGAALAFRTSPAHRS